MNQLPISHLPVSVENFMAFRNGLSGHHPKTILGWKGEAGTRPNKCLANPMKINSLLERAFQWVQFNNGTDDIPTNILLLVPIKILYSHTSEIVCRFGSTLPHTKSKYCLKKKKKASPSAYKNVLILENRFFC